jgi:type I restriction enzyme S subunit
MKWERVTVGSLRSSEANSLVGGPFGSDLTTRDYVEDGIPIIRGANLPDHTIFSEDEFVYVSEEKADLLRANAAHRGDVIFTQRGTLGQVGFIPPDSRHERYVISQSQMKLTVDRTRVEPEFVYYYFRSPATVQEVRNRAITSGVPHINLGILRDLTIPLPPIDTQHRIVGCLRAYDDLIENNRQRIQLLEQSTRLLYKEWFVHLRFPGHEHARGGRESEAGWERKRLGDVVTLKRGYDLPAAIRRDGSIPVVSSSGITGFHSEKKADAPGVVTGRYGTIGEVYFVQQDYWPLNTALYVSEFNGHSPLFVFHLLKHELSNIRSDKAAIPGLDRNVLHERSICYPPKRWQEAFTELIQPGSCQIRTLTALNQKLARARDLLLPRLMSGELTV